MSNALKEFACAAITELLKDIPYDKRMVGLTPEQRMAGLTPEQRLAGLSPEQRLAGLSREELRTLLEAAQRRLRYYENKSTS